MKQPHPFVTIAAIQALTLTATVMYRAGIEWIDLGEGLHPMLAGALAVFFILVPYAANYNPTKE